MSEPLRIQVETASGAYPVWVGRGLLPRLGALLMEAGTFRRFALVADERVLSLWGEEVMASLPPCAVFPVPPGEEAKSLRWAERLWGGLIEGGFGRGDCVLALGGGATGDLAGFVAATFHRGIPFVQIPTTLLAQVDASVGGKTAIDHPLGKNLVGAFHQPSLVVADEAFLHTLDERERWSGLAEMVKAAFLADRDLVQVFEAHLEAFARGERPTSEAVARSIRIKAEVVGRDERDRGPRNLLNLGHTVGHALEATTGFSLLTHGEAVVLGMKAAGHVSRRLGTLGGEDAERALALLSRFPLPDFPIPSAEDLLRAIKRDKKSVGGDVRFVVLHGLGKAGLVTVDERLLLHGIEGMWA